MKFRIEATYDADPDDVAMAYADPSLYVAFAELPRAGAPEILEHRVDGDAVDLRVRWRFTAELAAAARRVIDPAKLTWVEESHHDLLTRSVTWVMVPDNYRDRFACEGSYRFEPRDDGAVRIVAGDLRVKAPLVARVVENAIVSGLDDQLHAEVPVVESWLAALGG